MPQIEEAQFVNWGSMRPDIIPLASPGVTIAVGPNGSGKSCWLDGLKLMLGVAELSQRRTPSSYIFNGGPSNVPADQAWLRATFANPVPAGQRHRVFAVAGSGCENAEHVTVICRVQGDRRRYLVLPGHITWGRNHPIEQDLDDLAKLPDNRWLGPQRYDHLLERAGVSKALRGVLSLPQGETDRLVMETRSGLMRRLLELTGRQSTLDEFRLARAKYFEAKSLYRDALQQFEHKKMSLLQLNEKVRQHREWTKLSARLVDITSLLLPAAQHYEAKDNLEIAISDLRAKEVEIAALRGRMKERREEIESKQAEAGEFENAHREAAELAEGLRTRAEAAAKVLGQREERAATAWRDFHSAWMTVGRASLEAATTAVESAEVALADCITKQLAIDAQTRALLSDMERINQGGSMAPAPVREFCQLLADASIEAVILGDQLVGHSNDPAMIAHAQAALGDAVWAVIVPAVSYKKARELAARARYGWPVACMGPGKPTGVLQFVEGAYDFGALLARLDAAAAPDQDAVVKLLATAVDATTIDGMRHGPVLSRMSPVHDHILHPEAREIAISQIRKSIEASRSTHANLAPEATLLRERLGSAYALLNSVRHLRDLRLTFRAACSELADARAESRSVKQESAAAASQAQILYGRFQAHKTAIDNLESQLTADDELLRNANTDLAALTNRRLIAELAVAENSLPLHFTDAELTRLEPSSELMTERKILEAATTDLNRFPEDIRDPLVVSQCESEEIRLTEVDQLVAGKGDELESRQGMVTEARRRYDDHIGALVRRLRDKFSEICELAGIEGKIDLVPGDIEDEYGIDVLVAHKVGERPASYRDGIHSGGQGTKIAIMLLLAAMSLGRTADLLIVDEHNAHLDGTNAGQIAQLMRQLSDRVQFILSSPTDIKGRTNAEWCDIQVAFLPRRPGATFSPPVRLMSRLDASGLNSRFESQQLRMI